VNEILDSGNGIFVGAARFYDLQPLDASSSGPHSEGFTSSKLNCLSSLSYGFPSTSTYG